MKVSLLFSWILRIAAAAILLQTLYFKFTGQPESVALFTTLGVEPWGRIGTGIMELIASLLLLLPSTVIIGAVMGTGIMTGAVLSHLAILGIESAGDGGQLFYLAISVLLCCAALLYLHRKEALGLVQRFLKKSA